MKKILSTLLAAIMLATLAVSCAPATDQIDPAITLASSDAYVNAEWLTERLDTVPDDVIIGIGSNEKYGIDMSDFKEDGYIARAMNDQVLLFGAAAEGLDRAVREYAKAVDAGTVHELDTVYHEGEIIENLTIAGKSIADYTIVYDFDVEPIPTSTNEPSFGDTKFAAQELQKLLKKATGYELPLSKNEVKGPMFKLAYMPDKSLGDNGFTYEVKNGNVYITGAKWAHGVANGVYYFLQEECGWDALMIGDSDLQEADTVDVPNGTKATVDPIFDFLEFYYHGNFLYENDRDPSTWRYDGRVREACHGMTNNDWPGGTDHWSQICYTDENTYLNAYDTIYTHIKNRLAAGQELGYGMDYIDIAAADCYGWCRCTDCMKIYREEGRTYSGAVVRWANRIESEMDGEGLDGIIFLIFAYHGTNAPCKTAVNQDVAVTFCFDGACSNHPLDGSECEGISFVMGDYDPEIVEFNNSHYAAWLRGWNEICENLYVWQYAMDHEFGQYPYYDNVYSDLVFLKECGVNGMFWQGAYSGFGYQRLRYQFITAFQYNPEMTEEEFLVLRDEIMQREYGDGYKFVQDYMYLLEQTFASEYNCWNCWSSELMQPWIYNCEMYAYLADNMVELLDKALEQANSADQEMRITLILTEVLYRQCYSTFFLAYEQDDTETMAHLEDQFARYLECAYYIGYIEDGMYLFETFGDGKWDDRKVYTDIVDEALRFWYPYIGDGSHLLLDDTLDRELPQEWLDKIADFETGVYTDHQVEVEEE